MKDIAVTRKIKEALSAHFDAKGTINNVKGDLARVPMSVRQSCFEHWKKRQTR